MGRQERQWRAVAGVSGFMAVAMGAVGAHAVGDAHLAEMVQRASFYQLVHSVLLVWLAGQTGKGFAAARWLDAAGMVLFCGSLYVKALTGLEQATALAPLGGFGLMGAWLMIAWAKQERTGA